MRIEGYDVWYRWVGTGATPLLVLHGGPGAGHDYMESLERLSTGRPVIFYDQLGCGKSAQPDEASLWRIGRFVKEVGEVRQALKLDKVHLLGHSWGGWLAIDYMLTKPQGVISLTLASTSASVQEFVTEASRLKMALPKEMREIMKRCESSGDFENSEYEGAVMEFYRRHLCRLNPWPDSLMRSFHNLDGNAVYATMNGPNEFMVTGNLKNWDRIARLGEITVPTLITVGRFDEIAPACSETLHRGIVGSELKVFEQSSHMAHLEQPDEYIQTLADFLFGVEASCG